MKRRLLELFALCRADSFGEAAAYCVYRGDDKTRRWRDVYHFADRDERREVISICTRIKTLLAGSEGYGFKRFTSRRETEGVWNVWVVPFRRGGSVEEASFGFIRAKGRYVLGDIA